MMNLTRYAKLLFSTLLLLLCNNVVFAADDLDYPLTRISERIHVIFGPTDLPSEKNRGFRNNPVLVTTSNGIVLFDPGGSAAAGRYVVDKAKSLHKGDIVVVFNSHAHGDHWLGNEAVRDAFPNAVIYSHANARNQIMSSDGLQWLTTINEATKGNAEGKRVVAPDKTVKDGDVITVGDVHFRIYHTGPAHTDGDIMVEIVEENTLLTGDIIRNGMLGIMDSNPSFKGDIQAIDAMLAKHFKLYIPGHGKAGGEEIMLAYRRYMSTLYEGVKKLYPTGMADYEMKEKLLPQLTEFKQWNAFDMRVGEHISQVYLEVEKEGF